MPLKSILVHVDQNNSAGALQTAMLLAEKFDAHVSGFAMERRIYVPTYVAAELPAELLQSLGKQQQQHQEVSKQAFDKKMNEAGRVSRASWDQGVGEVSQLIGRRSCLNDLTIVTQDNPDKTSNKIVDEILGTAAGGVLVVPYIGIGETVGNSVAVAWNDSPEAARAVRAALPILMKAKSVEVIIISKSDEDQFTGSEVSQYLSEHGIKVSLKIVADSDRDVANERACPKDCVSAYN